MNNLWVAYSEVVSHERKHLCSLLLFRRPAQAKSPFKTLSGEGAPELALC